jgi:hypothetical protein
VGSTFEAERTPAAAVVFRTLALGGRVESLAGERLTGVSVSTRGGRLVRTDGGGRFVFPALPLGEYELFTNAPGYAALPAPPVRLIEHTEEGVLLLMESARALRGTVRAADGTLLSGVRIAACMRSVDAVPRFDAEASELAPFETQTNDQGVFELTCIPAGRTQLSAELEGYIGFGRVVSTASADLEITLSSFSGVFGRVVSPTGEPLFVTRASLIVPTRDADGPWKVMDDPSGISDSESAEGRFELHPRTRRPMRVVAEGPDFRRAVSREFRLDGSNDIGPLTLTAEKGPRISGVIRDERGNPVPGAEIVINEAPGPNALVQVGAPFRSAPVRSGPDGRFVTAPLAQGTLTLHAHAAGHRSATTPITRLPDEVELVMSRTGSLAGRVRADGGVLPDAWVRVQRVSAHGFETPPQRLEHSEFFFAELSPGVYTVGIFAEDPGRRADGNALVVTEAEVTAGSVTPVAFDLTSAGSLHGLVLVNGIETPYCQVTVQCEWMELRATCTTDAEGGFAFSGLPTGSYELSVRTSSDLSAHGHTSVEVQAGRDRRQDLLVETGALMGMVVDAESDTPLSGVRMRFEQQLPGQEELSLLGEGHTDENGVWSHAELPIGPVFVTPTQRFWSGPKRVLCEVSSGGDGVASQLEMRAAGQLELLLRAANSKPSAKLEVTLRPNHGDKILAQERRAGAGRMQMGDLAPGMYQVEVLNLATSKKTTATASVRVGQSEIVVVEF